jgi:hypothetical protein
MQGCQVASTLSLLLSLLKKNKKLPWPLCTTGANSFATSQNEVKDPGR